jgi:Tfp pilus assembly protein PilN
MSQQINLLTSAFRKERRGAAAVLLSVVGFALLSAGLGTAYEHHRLRQTQSEAEAVARELAKAQAQRDEVKTEAGVREGTAQREAELAQLLSQIKRRKDVIDAVKGGAAGTSAGFSEFMLAFSRRSVDGVWLTGFDIDAGGRELTLSGRALSADLVPRYLEGLNRESLMQGRQFASLQVEQVIAQSNPPVPEHPAAAERSPSQTAAAAPDKPALPGTAVVLDATGAGSAPADAQRAAKSAKPKPVQLRYVQFTMATANAGRTAAAQPGSLALVPGIGAERRETAAPKDAPVHPNASPAGSAR